jgi:hypothetical protein
MGNVRVIETISSRKVYAACPELDANGAVMALGRARRYILRETLRRLLERGYATARKPEIPALLA